MKMVCGILLLAAGAVAQTTGPIDINRRARPPAPKPEVIVIPDEPVSPEEAQPVPDADYPDTRPAADPADPGPPVLRRRSSGVNADAERHQDQPFPVEPPAGGFPIPPELDEDAASVAYEPQPPVRALHPDPVIAQAMEANQEFSYTLPDFICTQLMERATSPNLGKKWKDDPAVEAEVLVIDDNETYQNITIGGEPYDGQMMDIQGTRSAGEYGTVLWNLFDERSKTKFRSDGEEEIRGKSALIYTFHVEKPRAQWRIVVNNREIMPSYSGRVWLEKGTGRALRIEMQALQIPSDFPISTAELELDFDDVSIGDRTYLLPVTGGNMSCASGGATCYRNVLTWSHHRRFEAVSSVFNTDSTIDFGTEEVSAEGEQGEVEAVPPVVYPDPK